MNKVEIQHNIQELSAEAKGRLAGLPIDHWKQEVITGKWSIAEQLNHLLLSAYPILGILKKTEDFFQPFGKPKNGSRSYDDLYTEYINYNNGVRIAPPAYTPKVEDLIIGAPALSAWDQVLEKTIDRVDLLWSEDRLDQTQITHPAMGLMTIRELLYFKHFHARHHFKAIAALIGAIKTSVK